jgi:hypothetical protein
MVYFTVTTELSGDLYRKAIDAIAERCVSALLVKQPSMTLHGHGKMVLQQLEPFLQSREEVSEWPGTKLTSGTATVMRYRLAPECVRILKTTVESIYEWAQPDMPEDLCFLRVGGDPYFGSITHERDCFFVLSDVEYFDLIKRVPELASFLKRDET